MDLAARLETCDVTVGAELCKQRAGVTGADTVLA